MEGVVIGRLKENKFLRSYSVVSVEVQVYE